MAASASVEPRLSLPFTVTGASPYPRFHIGWAALPPSLIFGNRPKRSSGTVADKNLNSAGLGARWPPTAPYAPLQWDLSVRYSCSLLCAGLEALAAATLEV